MAGYDPIQDLGVNPSQFIANKVATMKANLDSTRAPTPSGQVGPFKLPATGSFGQQDLSASQPQLNDPSQQSNVNNPTNFNQQASTGAGAAPPMQQSQQMPLSMPSMPNQGGPNMQPGGDNQPPSTPQYPQAVGQFGVVPQPGSQNIGGIMQLGKMVKAKYPEYADMTDTELGQKVLAKYPQYQDIVDKGSVTPQQQPQDQTQGSSTLGNIVGGIAQGAAQLGQGIGDQLSSAEGWIGKKGADIAGSDTFVGGLARHLLNIPSLTPEQAKEVKDNIDKYVGGFQDYMQANLPDNTLGKDKTFPGYDPNSVASNAGTLAYNGGTLAELGPGAFDLARASAAAKLLPATMRVGEIATKGAGLLAGDAANITPKAVALDKPAMKIANAVLDQSAAAQEARASDATIVNGVRVYPPTKAEIPLLKTAQKIGIDGTEDRIANLNKVETAMKTEADKLRTMVKDNPVTFTPQEVTKKLNDIEVPPMIKSDATLNNSYNIAKQRFVDILKSQPKMNAEGMLDARQEFDSWVAKSYPNLYTSETMSPMKSAIMDIRRGVNDMLAERVGGTTEVSGNGGKTFSQSIPVKESLAKQTQLYSIRDGIKTDLPKQGETVLDRLEKKYPIGSKIAKKAGTKILGGAALGAIGYGIAKGTSSTSP